jgi:hypothetical protein
MSGKIETSDASELWDEARSIRDDYKDRLAKANDRTLGLEVRIAGLEGDNHELVKENLRLTHKVEIMQATIDELRDIIVTMQSTIDTQRSALRDKGSS